MSEFNREEKHIKIKKTVWEVFWHCTITLWLILAHIALFAVALTDEWLPFIVLGFILAHVDIYLIAVAIANNDYGKEWRE